MKMGPYGPAPFQFGIRMPVLPAPDAGDGIPSVKRVDYL